LFSYNTPMNVFPFLHFFNVIVYSYLAVYVLVKNPRALLNRVCAITFLCIGTWSFSMIFIHNPHTSKETAWIFAGIGSIGWTTFSSFYLLLILIFSGKKELLRKKWLYPVLFAIPLLLIYKQWTNFIFVDFTMEYYGWKALYAKNIWPHLMYIYYMSFMCVGLYINFDFMRKTPNTALKQQAKIIFVTVSTAFVLAAITDTVLPLMDHHTVPNMGETIILIWAFGVVYGMIKHKFLAITPTTAAVNIISTMFDSLILLDLQGCIVTVNKAALNLSGYTEEELKGTPATVLLADEELAVGVVDEIVKEKNLKNKDLLLKTKDGKKIPILFSSSVLRDETGAAGGIVCVAKDISERKRLEKELFKTKKLESIGILAGGIAHDFNNILSVILGNILMARRKISPESEAYDLLVKAEEASMKAAELAERFVTFSPGGWVKADKIRLPEFIEELEASGLPDAGRNISYRFDIPENVMPILGDAEQLSQVMKSLFLNSVEAITEDENKKGEIRVQAENTLISDFEDAGKYLLNKGKYVKITIHDNGSGISPSNLEKVFDPYFSTKDNVTRKGIGLGLTTCYSIMKKHQGHITVESEAGKGTSVSLYLPVSG
jgi:PAS domain S-box-containing protein